MSTSSPTLDRFDYVTPNDVYAALADGGGVSVEEWANGELQPIAKRVEGQVGVLLVQIEQDFDTVHATVSTHPDESNKLALIGQAIQALEDARDALKASGYVDFSDRRAGADQ